MYVLLFPLHWEVTRLLYFIKIVFWTQGTPSAHLILHQLPGSAVGGGWGGLTAGCSKGEGGWYEEGIQMGRKENLPVWGKYDRLYGVV